jgi:cytochrome c-type biogenesis protein CcmH/NrfG
MAAARGSMNGPADYEVKMPNSMPPQKPSHSPTNPETARTNRYILVAVLAVVALVTIYLIKTNLEPPKVTQGQTSAEEEQSSENGGSPATMQDVAMHAEHIKGILAKDSTNYDAWVALGNLYFDDQKPAEAIAYYEGALKLRSGDPNVMTDLATMKRALGKPSEAVDLLKQVVAKDSTMGQAWFNLGVIYSFDLNNSKDAIAAWKRYLNLDPLSQHAQAVQKVIDSLERTLK